MERTGEHFTAEAFEILINLCEHVAWQKSLEQARQYSVCGIRVALREGPLFQTDDCGVSSLKLLLADTKTLTGWNPSSTRIFGSDGWCLRALAVAGYEDVGVRGQSAQLYECIQWLRV